MQIVFSKASLRALGRIPTNTAKLIRSKLDQYASNPASLANNVKALKGEKGVYRLRVGDWRILFTEDGKVIAILAVTPRGGAYGLMQAEDNSRDGPDNYDARRRAPRRAS